MSHLPAAESTAPAECGRPTGRGFVSVKRATEERITDMPDAKELLHSNLHEVFSERDPDERRAAIERTYAEDVKFIDPEGEVVGRRSTTAPRSFSTMLRRTSCSRRTARDTSVPKQPPLPGASARPAVPWPAGSTSSRCVMAV
jgi:hypothetical protein